MKKEEVKKIFRKVYNDSKNFITPEILDYREEGNFLVELSKGRGILGDENIFGVTVLEKENGGFIRSPDHCKCFSSLEDAEEYIAGLSLKRFELEIRVPSVFIGLEGKSREDALENEDWEELAKDALRESMKWWPERMDIENVYEI